MKSVMALDSAYCCHSHRSDFLSLLQSNEYFVREELVIRASVNKLGETVEGFDVRMLERFGEKLRSVSFQGEFSPAQVRSLRQHCHNLTHVSYNDTEAGAFGVWVILKGNTHIESLNAFLHFFAAGDLENSLPKLKSLTVCSRKDWHVITTTPMENACAINAMKLSNSITCLSFSTKLSPSTLLQIPVLCPHLTSLEISNADLTDGLLHSITAACPDIVHLDISTNYSYELTDAGILSVVQNLKRLQSLNTLRMPRLTDAALVHIYTHCASTLHTLYFGCCNDAGPMYSAEAVNTLLQRCTQLRTVHFEENHYSMPIPPGIDLLPASLSNITTLVLDGVTCEKTLPIVAEYATNLKVLYIADYTRRSLMPLWNGCPSLRELYICFKPDMDEKERLDDDFSEFVLFTMDAWMKVRPGLLIQRCNMDLLEFRAKDMP